METDVGDGPYISRSKTTEINIFIGIKQQEAK